MTNKINHAVILAGGKGIRLKPITNSIPKAMAPYNGSTLIDHTIKNLQTKIKNVHITAGYKGSILAEYVFKKKISSIINTSDRGNSWFLFNSIIKQINEPIIVITSDIVGKININMQIKEYYKLKKPACMIIPAKYNKNINGDFIFTNECGLIKDINRKNKSDIMASGIQILNPSQINKIITKTNNFSELWNKLIKKKQLYSSNKLLKNWFSVDNIRQLEFINKMKKK